jgi:hypothetical protein
MTEAVVSPDAADYSCSFNATVKRLPVVAAIGVSTSRGNAVMSPLAVRPPH